MTGGQAVRRSGGHATRARAVVVSAKGAARWQAGHPWIYRSDVYAEPDDEPGIVAVTDRRGRFLGQALYSPRSEIRVRLLTTGDERIDAAWWGARIAAAAARRGGIPATAYRVVHAEGDGLPSLIVDRYGPYVVAQLLSAGIERAREDVIAGIRAALAPEGILFRNDAAIRRHEGLPLEVVPACGAVPETVEVEEHGVRYLAAPHAGQKTGAFLDQRENRMLVAAHAGRGRALDLFTYHGSFALHLARRAAGVIAVDASAEALARGAENAALNGLANVTWREANAFDRDLRHGRAGPARLRKDEAERPARARGLQGDQPAGDAAPRAGWRALHLLLLLPRRPGGLRTDAGGRRARFRPPPAAPRPDGRRAGSPGTRERAGDGVLEGGAAAGG